MLITVSRLCEETQMDKKTVFRLASRESDPLPLCYLKGTRKYGRVLTDEFEEWWLRNSVPYTERKKEVTNDQQ